MTTWVPANGNISEARSGPLLVPAFAPLFRRTKTLHLKVKPEAWAWLDQAAREVNGVWNFCNATSRSAWQNYHGQRRWLSAYDLNPLLAGCGDTFDRIGIDVAQCVSAEHATKRDQYKKSSLRFRRSGGSNRSLGWVPFKGPNLKLIEVARPGFAKLPRKPAEPKIKAKKVKRLDSETGKERTVREVVESQEAFQGRYAAWNAALAVWHTTVAAMEVQTRFRLSFMGKTIRLFNQDYLLNHWKAMGRKLRSGNFAQNSLGEWFLNVVVEEDRVQLPALLGPMSSIGLDPGCKNAMTGSDGFQVSEEATRLYREAESKIARLQKRGHPKQAKRVHLKVKNRRRDAVNKESHHLVTHYQHVLVGNARSQALASRKKKTDRSDPLISQGSANPAVQPATVGLNDDGFASAPSVSAGVPPQKKSGKDCRKPTAVTRVKRRRRLGKSVLDAAWGLRKATLSSFSHKAGRVYLEVDERNTTRTCSACGALTGPTGWTGLVERRWTCSAPTCGAEHDRDQNSGKLIEMGGWQAMVAGHARETGRSWFSDQALRACPKTSAFSAAPRNGRPFAGTR